MNATGGGAGPTLPLEDADPDTEGNMDNRGGVLLEPAKTSFNQTTINRKRVRGVQKNSFMDSGDNSMDNSNNIFGIDYPTVRIPKLWSLEDLEIRNIKKLDAFKSALYSKLVDGYHTEVSCDNPYCRDCN